VETGSILNVKKIRKHLDENDEASVLVFHSENPQMSLRNRSLQTGIEFIITYTVFLLVFLFCQLYFTISQNYFLSLLNVTVPIIRSRLFQFWTVYENQIF
jgi:hypothetical protein